MNHGGMGAAAGTPAALAFANSAASGQVAIDPDAAQGALAKIRSGKDTVQRLITDAGVLSERPKLGANPVGQAMAHKMAGRAEGSAGCYVDELHKLLSQYVKAEEGLVNAMKNFRDTDDDALRQINQVR